MPVAPDFRITKFSVDNVKRSGSSVGRNFYWKLYSVENYYRVIIHSVLSAQLGRNWWLIAADPEIQKKAKAFKKRYLAHPWYTQQGGHDIYYIDLNDLNEIARANSNLLEPIINDVDQWILRVETIRLPRNVIAHMNFPNNTDQSRINILYQDFRHLINLIGQNPTFVPIIP